MRCGQCGTHNDSGQIYCKACGVQLDLTYDAVHQTVADQIQDEREQDTERQVRQWMVLVILLFLVALTAKSLAGTVPDQHAAACYVTDRIPFEEDRFPVYVPWLNFSESEEAPGGAKKTDR